jgi:catechol 1,2-dioxygenase
MADHHSRRTFLQLSAGGLWLAAPAAVWALGCRPSVAEASAPPPPPACSTTEPNIEGPYYRADAPFRADLVEADVHGTSLVVGGRVLSADCRSPLAGAVLDVWQADGDGHYDNDGTMHLPKDRFRLRGKLRTDDGGAFSVRTVWPGRYLNGRVYRPSHVHVKVSAAGHRPLTTQLYFPGDPYNDVDPFIRRSLIMDVSRDGSGQRAHYDFVLVPA